MKTIHPGHLEHKFCIFGCQILCITDLAIMPQCWIYWSRLGFNFLSWYLMGITVQYITNSCRAANYQKLLRCSPTSLTESSMDDSMCTTWSTGWRRRTWWWTSRLGRRWWSSKGCRCLLRAWGSPSFRRIQEKKLTSAIILSPRRVIRQDSNGSTIEKRQ